jgi:ubiquinone/menaquinone biosynthesis C-methylase UbiE
MSSNSKFVSQPTQDDLTQEWDNLALERHKDILEGRDISYTHVLMPALMKFAATIPKGSDWVDAGCGTGHLSEALAKLNTGRVIGIDPSSSMVRLAKATIPHSNNACFFQSTLEKYSEANQSSASSIFANMVLQNVPNIEFFLAAANRILSVNGVIIASIPHPCFWPIHYGYDQAEWFRYQKETWIKAPFRTALKSHYGYFTTHAHRPIEMYFKKFSDAGFLIELVLEPQPESDIDYIYPKGWQYPRFMFLKARSIVQL